MHSLLKNCNKLCVHFCMCMFSSAELNVTELFCIVLDRISTTWTIKMLGRCWVGLVFRAMLTQFSSVTCLVVRSHALPLQTSPAAGQMFLFWYVLGRLLRVDLITLEGEMSFRQLVCTYVRPSTKFFRFSV